MMMDQRAVSQLIGLILVLAIESIVVASALYGTSAYVDSRVKQLGVLQAHGVVNSVANAVTEAVAVSRLFPNVNYSQTISVPLKLGDRYYYLEITTDTVYANSTDGSIQVNSTTYKVENIPVQGRVFVSSEEIEVAYENGGVVLRQTRG
ncbi:MAG TPA: hypothetical protein ENI45_03760 [Thermoplasmatales archaeon]|nr:hypothetical protein [Thermoplasmatales archaeon]